MKSRLKFSFLQGVSQIVDSNVYNLFQLIKIAFINHMKVVDYYLEKMLILN